MKQFHNTNTTITMEVMRPVWFKCYLAENSHPTDRTEGYAVPKPEILPFIHPTQKIVVSPIEHRALNGAFDPSISPRSFRREYQRWAEGKDICYRGRSRESIDSNRRNAKRQRIDVTSSRFQRQLRDLTCNTCGTDWFRKPESRPCCNTSAA